MYIFVPLRPFMYTPAESLMAWLCQAMSDPDGVHVKGRSAKKMKLFTVRGALRASRAITKVPIEVSMVAV